MKKRDIARKMLCDHAIDLTEQGGGFPTWILVVAAVAIFCAITFPFMYSM